MAERRLKRWNKELGLTAEQQAKIKAMLTEESKLIAKLDEDKALPVSARAAKIDEMHQATYEKIKPLLTETQAPLSKELTTKVTKPRKAAAPANPQSRTIRPPRDVTTHAPFSRAKVCCAG